MIGLTGECTDVTARIRSACRAFNELLSILTKRGISLLNCGKVLKASVRSVLLYGSEAWPMSTGDLSHIKTSDHTIIKWICGER